LQGKACGVKQVLAFTHVCKSFDGKVVPGEDAARPHRVAYRNLTR
jgi:hypothetical protein